MIWESLYWKTDLLKVAKRLEKRKHQKKWYDASFANAEKDIMISAFMVRKLFDSHKIDKRIDESTLPVTVYNSNGKKIHRLKVHYPERCFDIENPVKSTLKVRDLCNQIIHSYVSILIMNEQNSLQAYWFVSDYDKFKRLIQIQIDEYLDIIEIVGNYWPVSEYYEFDEKKRDYVIDHVSHMSQLNDNPT